MIDNSSSIDESQLESDKLVKSYERSINNHDNPEKISIFETLKINKMEWLYEKFLFTILNSDYCSYIIEVLADKAKRFFPNGERKITNLKREKFTDNNNKNRVDLYFEVGKTIVLMELKVRGGCRKHQLADYYFDIKNKTGNDQMICIFYITPTGEIPENSDALVYSKDSQKMLIHDDANNANLFSISYSDLIKKLPSQYTESSKTMGRLINEFKILCGHTIKKNIDEVKAFHIAYLNCLREKLSSSLARSGQDGLVVVDDSECFSENFGLNNKSEFYQSVSLKPKNTDERRNWKLCFEVGYSCLSGNKVDKNHLRILYGIKRIKNSGQPLKTDIEKMFMPFLESNFDKGLYWNGDDTDLKDTKKRWRITSGSASRHTNNDWWLIAHIADWMENILCSCKVDDELTDPQIVANWMIEDFLAILDYQKATKTINH